MAFSSVSDAILLSRIRKLDEFFHTAEIRILFSNPDQERFDNPGWVCLTETPDPDPQHCR